MKFFSHTFILTLFALLTKFIVLSRDIIFAAEFGFSELTDAYFFSTSFFLLISALSIQCINSTVVPVFSKSKFHNFNFTLFNLVISFLLSISVLIVLFYYLLNLNFDFFKIILPGFSSFQLNYVRTFTSVIFPTLLLVLLVAFFRGVLQSNNKFLETSFSEIFLPIMTIIFIFFVDDYGFIVLVIPFILSPFIQLLIQISSINNVIKNFSFNFNFFDFEFKKLLILMLPLLLSGIFSSLTKIVDFSFASVMSSGVLSALNISNKLNLLIMSVAIIPLITVLFPAFSTMNANVKKLNLSTDFFNLLFESFYKIFFLSLPVSFFVYFNSYFLVDLIFGYGNFLVDDVSLTSECLKYICLGVFFVAFRLLFIKVFYSFKDTFTPVVLIVICSTLNVLLNYFLVPFYSFYGLIISTIIANFILCVCLFLMFCRITNFTVTTFFLYRFLLVIFYMLTIFFLFYCFSLHFNGFNLFLICFIFIVVYYLILLHTNFFRSFLCLNQKFY